MRELSSYLRGKNLSEMIGIVLLISSIAFQPIWCFTKLAIQ
jgi:hypothetical protein